MKKFFKFSILPLLVISLAFIQTSAQEDILLELTHGEGDLLMYFVDGDDGYIASPSAISFETSNTSFAPVDVDGTFGVSSQKLRIDNATGSEVELAVALDVTDFATDAKWIDGGEDFLAYSTDGTDGGLLVDPSGIVLTDDDCAGLSSTMMTSDRFTYMGEAHENNVESIDVLNTTGGDNCRFDLTNLLLTQTIPPRTSAGNYSLGMVLTLTAGAGAHQGGWYSCATVDIGEECGGGIVAYHDGAGGGLIAATSDQSAGIQWGCRGTSISTSTDYGTGAANTSAIVAFHEGWADPWNTGPESETCDSNNDGTVAARLASEYDGGGYDDWFLPSKDELNHLYVNHVAIGGFDTSTSGWYWSSSEHDSTHSLHQRFSDGLQGTYGKDYTRRVRAVRAF